MKRQQPEFRLQCVIADYLHAQHPFLLWFAVPNGEKRSPITGARLKRMGVRAGVADILIFYGERFMAIELKAGKGTLQDTQRDFRNAWLSSGGLYDVVRSLEELQSCLNEWGIPKIQKCPAGYAIGSVLIQYTKPKKKGAPHD